MSDTLQAGVSMTADAPAVGGGGLFDRLWKGLNDFVDKPFPDNFCLPCFIKGAAIAIGVGLVAVAALTALAAASAAAATAAVVVLAVVGVVMLGMTLMNWGSMDDKAKSAFWGGVAGGVLVGGVTKLPGGLQSPVQVMQPAGSGMGIPVLVSPVTSTIPVAAGAAGSSGIAGAGTVAMASSGGGGNTPKKGNIDESEKQFSPEEKKIAEKLADEGKDVKAVKERPDTRNADALVDGKPTEFKSFEPNSSPTDGTIKNTISNSIKRGGQARDVIIDSRGSGLSKADALKGLGRAENITRGKIDSVRVLGDGFDETSVNFK